MAFEIQSVGCIVRRNGDRTLHENIAGGAALEFGEAGEIGNPLGLGPAF